MSAKNSLIIILWNADGLSNKFDELRALTEDHSSSSVRKPDLILIQETKLPPTGSFNISGYILYRSDRSAYHNRHLSGGTAIFIKNTLSHNIMNFHHTSHLGKYFT